MTLQREIHDLKNHRRFHIGHRGLPHAFLRRMNDAGIYEDDETYHARLRAEYPHEEALRGVMLESWKEDFCVQSPEMHAYVGAMAAHAYRFCVEAEWQIDVMSDSGDDYGKHGPHGEWPLVFSVYGDDYIDDDERPVVPWAVGQERFKQ